MVVRLRSVRNLIAALIFLSITLFGQQTPAATKPVPAVFERSAGAVATLNIRQGAVLTVARGSLSPSGIENPLFLIFWELIAGFFRYLC